MFKIFFKSGKAHREMMLQGLANYIYGQPIEPKRALELYERLCVSDEHLTKLGF